MIVEPKTEVQLLSNVPLTPNQEHQITFANIEAQSSFFYNKANYVFTDFTYVKEDSTIKVPRGRDSLYACNYLMFRNADFGTKWFYAFVTKLEYVNPETTKVHFEIDVFQTWQFNIDLKPSYVVREHTKRWNSDGTPVVNTLDEGLDYGSEYETVHVDRVQPYGDVFFLVMVSKTAMHHEGGTDYTNKIMPTVNAVPQPLNYYVHPFKLDGSSPKITVGGNSYSGSSIKDVLQGLFTQEGAVNNVVSLYVTEYFDNIAYSSGTDTVDFPSFMFEQCSIVDGTNLTVNTLRLKRMYDYRSRLMNVGNKYTGYYTSEESKLYMYPYTVTVLTDFKGNQIELKNELIQDRDLQIRVRGSLGTSNKVAYTVENYNVKDGTPYYDLMGMEQSLINNNANDIPILSEMLSAYLQGNRNALENQKNSLMYNAVSNAIMGGAFGMLGGGGKLGAVGAAAGLVDGAANTYFQIEGMNAKKKDIQNTPPNLNKMGGNVAFDYGNKLSGVYVVKKQITAEYRKRLGDYFKMFGYKVNELKTPNIRSRQHYNFIQTVGANVTGNVPQDDLVQIKELFNRGITFWHGDWVGDYTKANDER